MYNNIIVINKKTSHSRQISNPVYAGAMELADIHGLSDSAAPVSLEIYVKDHGNFRFPSKYPSIC
jgi:hypothetical protein